jgi:hypothetical protein
MLSCCYGYSSYMCNAVPPYWLRHIGELFFQLACDVTTFLVGSPINRNIRRSDVKTFVRLLRKFKLLIPTADSPHAPTTSLSLAKLRLHIQPLECFSASLKVVSFYFRSLNMFIISEQCCSFVRNFLLNQARADQCIPFQHISKPDKSQQTGNIYNLPDAVLCIWDM